MNVYSEFSREVNERPHSETVYEAQFAEILHEPVGMGDLSVILHDSIARAILPAT